MSGARPAVPARRRLRACCAGVPALDPPHQAGPVQQAVWVCQGGRPHVQVPLVQIRRTRKHVHLHLLCKGARAAARHRGGWRAAWPSHQRMGAWAGSACMLAAWLRLPIVRLGCMWSDMGCSHFAACTASCCCLAPCVAMVHAHTRPPAACSRARPLRSTRCTALRTNAAFPTPHAARPDPNAACLPGTRRQVPGGRALR